MSRIQTQTVAVNPNVELANREAPTIIYQPEPYVPETYFDYEQLSNVLGAGVQAAQTFLKTSLLDREMQDEIAADAMKQLEERFKVGLEEAKTLDKTTQTTGKMTWKNVNDFLAKWDYKSLPPNSQILWQKTLGEYVSEDLQQQRAFNAKIASSYFRNKADGLKGLADGGDLAAMSVLSSITDGKTAWNVILSQMTPDEEYVFGQISEFDQDMLRDELKAVIGGLVEAGSKESARINKASADRKKDMTIEISAQGVADTVIGMSYTSRHRSDLLDNLNNNIVNVRSMSQFFDPTIQESELDGVADRFIEQSANSVIERGTSQQIMLFRDAVADDSVQMNPAKKNELVRRLESQAQGKLTDEYTGRILNAETENNISELVALTKELEVPSRVLTDAQREELRSKSDTGVRSLITKRSKQVIDGTINDLLSQASAMSDIPTTFIDDAAATMNRMLDSNAFIVKGPDGNPLTDLNGRVIVGIDRKEVLQASAQLQTSLLQMQERKRNMSNELAVDKMITDTVNELSGTVGFVDFALVQSDFMGMMEDRGIAKNSPTYAAAERQFNTAIRQNFFRQMEQAYLQSLSDAFTTDPNNPVKFETLAPASNDSPQILEAKQQLRNLLNVNRVTWDMNGGDGSSISQFRTSLVGAFSSTATEGATNFMVRDAYEMYQLAANQQFPVEELLGRGPASNTIMQNMELIRGLMAGGMSFEDALRDAGVQRRFDTSGFMFTDIATNPGTSVDKENFGEEFNINLKYVTNTPWFDSVPWAQYSYSTVYSKHLGAFKNHKQAVGYANTWLKSNVVSVDGALLPKDMVELGEDYLRFAAKKFSDGRDDTMFVVVDLVDGKPRYGLRGNPKSTQMGTSAYIFTETDYVMPRTFSREEIMSQKLINEFAEQGMSVNVGLEYGTVPAGYERATMEDIQRGEEDVRRMFGPGSVDYTRNLRPSLGDLERQFIGPDDANMRQIQELITQMRPFDIFQQTATPGM